MARASLPEFLDIGGGFGIRYADEQPLALDRLFAGLAEKLRGGPHRLIIEPGRAIVGDAGVLLARVLYVKRNQQKNFIVVDAGMNDLMRPTLYGSYHEIVPVLRRPAETLTADVVGPLCETGDFLAQDRALPDVQPGDLLAILTSGAYGYVLASNYNTRPRPAEVLIDGDRAELIRPRERAGRPDGGKFSRQKAVSRRQKPGQQNCRHVPRVRATTGREARNSRRYDDPGCLSLPRGSECLEVHSAYCLLLSYRSPHFNFCRRISK